MTIQQIPLGNITLDPRLQMRDAMRFEAIDEYAEHLDDLPPCKVFLCDGEYFLTGGWHRYHAHKKGNRATLPCTVTEGTFNKAQLEAAGENHDHGIRRTNECKRRAVFGLLGNDEWAGKSNAWIASICHVSDMLVAQCRKEKEAQTDDGKEDESTSRTGGSENDPVLCERCARVGAVKDCPACEKLRTKKTTRTGRDDKERPAKKPRKKRAEKPKEEKPPQETALHVNAQRIVDALASVREVIQEACAGSDSVLRTVLAKQRSKLEMVMADMSLVLNPATPQAELQLPVDLDSDAFREAWAEWVTHRKQKKQALTQLSVKKQIAQCAAMGEVAAIASINASITSGWTGLFAPKKGGTNGRVSRVEAPAGKYDGIGTTVGRKT